MQTFKEEEDNIIRKETMSYRLIINITVKNGIC